MSHPARHGILHTYKDLCGFTYITANMAFENILTTSQSPLLAKVTINKAFHLPLDYVIAMSWNNKVLIGTCLPFCLHSA